MWGWENKKPAGCCGGVSSGTRKNPKDKPSAPICPEFRGAEGSPAHPPSLSATLLSNIHPPLPIPSLPHQAKSLKIARSGQELKQAPC